MSFIYYAQTKFPEYEYKQKEIREMVSRIWPDQEDLLNQFFESTGVKKRNFALPLSHYQKLGHFGERNNSWKREAVKLQKENVDDVLKKIKLKPDEIKLIASVNSTGVCVPSLETHIMNQLPLDPHVKRLPIFGLGCLGGVAGMNRLHDYLKGAPDETALLLVTELCSLTYQFQDHSIPNLVGSALFGDGTGIVLLVGKKHPLAERASLEILKTKSFFYPDTEHYMGWKMVAEGFAIELSSEIPNLVRSVVGKNVLEFITECGKEQSDIKFFIAHPGGPKVMEALMEALNMTRKEMALSWESLAEHGNVSSVSVIDVLARTLERKDLRRGDHGIMLAMGPAFSLEVSLVEKCGT